MAALPCFNPHSNLARQFNFEFRFHKTNLDYLFFRNAHHLFDERPHRGPNAVYCVLSSRFESIVDEGVEDSDGSGIGQEKREGKKKRRKQKLRRSFHEQALKRWSVKNLSQRTSFPWQEIRSGQDLSLPLSGKCSTDSVEVGIGGSGERLSFQRRDINSGKVSSLPLPYKCATDSDVAGIGGRGRGAQVRRNRVSSADERVVGRVSDCLGDDSLDSRVSGSSVLVSGKQRINEQPVTRMGEKPVPPPWLHGAKTREFGEDFGSKYVKLVENFKSHDDEKTVGKVLKGENLYYLLDENVSLDETLDNPSDDDHESPNFRAFKNLHAIETLDDDFRSHNLDLDHGVATQVPMNDQGLNLDGESKVTGIVDRLNDSVGDQFPETNSISFLNKQSVKVMGSVPLPWERDESSSKPRQVLRNRNTELAEKTIPELELRRLRDAALRMKDRMTVGAAGVSEAVVETIHKKWKVDEVVKLRFEGPPSLNMARTHEILEMKTGGVVIWRSGKSVVLYRGMTYKLPCIQAYSEITCTGPEENSNRSTSKSSLHTVGQSIDKQSGSSKMPGVHSLSHSNQSEGLADDSVIESLLDQLGPRFKNWSGRGPLPVDADLLPGVVPGYTPPFRLLPYKTRATLRDREMTSLRRIARSMVPHFALGRNRQHQGLASAMVKLWAKSAIAKIAIKRGVPNTSNERMAEEIKKLTGGVLLSRNKEYLVFYRGNDFVTPSVREVLIEKQTLATIHQDWEEKARTTLSASTLSSYKSSKTPLVAGTLSETIEAKAKWGNPLSPEEREKLRKNMDLAKHIALVHYFEKKMAFALAKVRKAEKALARVQAFLQPAELPTDLETVTDEERSLFRQIGLKMKGQSFLGRREVFDGTIENMHLNWKHREVVKILVKGKSFPLVKHIAISLEAESGGVLISVDKTTKGYAIVLYRGKNYRRPPALKPKNLLTRRQALARSIELQRREALNHHIATLREKIQMLKSQLDQMEADMRMGKDSSVNLQFDNSLIYDDDDDDDDDDIEDEGEEAYLQTYDSEGDDHDNTSSVSE